MLFLFVAIFVGTFFLIKFCGHIDTIQPGAASHKCECITYKETAKDFPFILFISSISSFVYLFLGYEYNLNKLRKEETLRKKVEQEQDKEQDKGGHVP